MQSTNLAQTQTQTKAIGGVDDMIRLVDSGFKGQAGPFLIEPTKAPRVLERNKPNNRLRTDSNVEKYAREMKASNWRLTHQGVGFDTNGHLCDGQTRFMACVKSDSPFLTYATFGLNPDDFIVMDTGEGRRPKDVFQILQIKQPTAASSAASLFYKLIKNHGFFGTSVKLPSEALAEIYQRTNRFGDTVEYVSGIAGRKSPVTVGHLIALHHVVAEVLKNPLMADEITKGIVTGANLQQGDPILPLLNRISRSTSRREQLQGQAKLALVTKVVGMKLREDFVDKLSQPNTNLKPYDLIPGLSKAVNQMMPMTKFADMYY